MRIARFTHDNEIHYGTVHGEPGQETLRYLSGDPLYVGVQELERTVAVSEARLLAPVIPRSKIVCVGRNYAEHAAEMGNDVPTRPLLFFKPNTAVSGPGDPVTLPAWTERVSYEAELAVVIGRMCKDVPLERVPEVVFGYTAANDLTARDSQRAENQWFRAKAFDTSCPIGPWIETDLDPAAGLAISSAVDGEPAQSGTTADMLRGIPELIAEISSVVTLLPGDLVLTGTPAGVRTVEAGASIDVTIEGIGTLTSPVVRR